MSAETNRYLQKKIGIQVAEAGYRYKPLGLVPHLGEVPRQI